LQNYFTKILEDNLKVRKWWRSRIVTKQSIWFSFFLLLWK
jgi:hypothetical protein